MAAQRPKYGHTEILDWFRLKFQLWTNIYFPPLNHLILFQANEQKLARAEHRMDKMLNDLREELAAKIKEKTENVARIATMKAWFKNLHWLN